MKHGRYTAPAYPVSCAGRPPSPASVAVPYDRERICAFVVHGEDVRVMMFSREQSLRAAAQTALAEYDSRALSLDHWELRGVTGERVDIDAPWPLAARPVFMNYPIGHGAE
jgi:hypothetical protein